MILSGSLEGAIAVLGVECSTFVHVNRGTSKRSELLPWGDTMVDSVYEANMATSRRILNNERFSVPATFGVLGGASLQQHICWPGII